MSLKITFIADEQYRECIPEPQPTSTVFPEWFSKLELPSKSKCPFSFMNRDNPYELQIGPSNNNVKNCPGIFDFLTTGYIIPAWDNFIFRHDDNEGLYVNWSSTYRDNRIDSHDLNQFYTMGHNERPSYDKFFKIYTPWFIRTSPGVSCLIIHPYWHRKNNFTTVSGVYHTDSQEMSLNWFLEWNYEIKTGMELESIDIENQTICKGDPIMMIIPFYRKSYEKEVKYVSTTEVDRLNTKVGGNYQSFKLNDPYRLFRKKLTKLFR